MIIGIGTDIARISRFEKWKDDEKLLRRFFSCEEAEYCLSSRDSVQKIAARFAAKEAFGKALGTGVFSIPLKDIRISNDEKGKPFFVLSGKALDLYNAIGAENIHLSISHEEEYAVAFVIIEGKF